MGEEESWGLFAEKPSRESQWMPLASLDTDKSTYLIEIRLPGRQLRSRQPRLSLGMVPTASDPVSSLGDLHLATEGLLLVGLGGGGGGGEGSGFGGLLTHC